MPGYNEYMKRLHIVFFHWLPLAAVIVGVCGMFYLSTQYFFRTALNDPQIQFTEDGARALKAGVPPSDIVPRYIFDAGESLSPFIAVFDADGNSLESSAYIDGKPLKLPAGVFQVAKAVGENRVTWQPNSTMRIALVVRRVEDERGYFVVAGRNMREGEAREAAFTEAILFALGALLLVTFLLELFGDYVRHRRQT